MPKVGGNKPDPTRARRRQPGDDPVPIAPGVVGPNLEPPPGMEEAARKVWRVVVPSLAKMGVLVEADLPYVIQYANAVALADVLIEDYWSALREYGAESSEVKRARVAWEKAVRVFDVLGSQLGANPVARARLGVTMMQGRSLVAHLEDALGETGS